ncbi:MAG TPA: hypothetical protein VMZ52_03200 [Bryobacteraceae bacterium]|nr:hypothetical protein [Bryobacteraceae bacterium]
MDPRPETFSRTSVPLMAGPVPTEAFCGPTDGGSSVTATLEGALPFQPAIRKNNLHLQSLRTTGFDDEAGYDTWAAEEWIEVAEPGVTVSATAEVPAVETPASVAPVSAKPKPRPILRLPFPVVKSSASEESASEYEAEPWCEFLDLEEEAPVTKFLPPAPPPEMAPAIEGLTFELKPSAPAGTIQQGFEAAPSPHASINAPALALQPLRKKLVFGADPNAKPKAPLQPVAAKPAAPSAAAATQKPAQAPSIKVRPPAMPAAFKTAAPKARPGVPAQRTQPPVVTRASEPVITPAVPATAPSFSMGPVNEGFWAGASGKMKACILATAAAIVFAGGAYMLQSGPSTSAANTPVTSTSLADGVPGVALGGGGWATNWGQDEPSNKNRQIQIYRPSMSITDYRIQLHGKIEKKAIGWIFRASNPKNYYVMKLEVVKPGLSPIIALVKYPVINGKEQTHTQVMLPSDLPLKMDTAYNIRTEVIGNKFTTYVQDKLVDYWTDDAIKLGGAGLYSEKGERAQIKTAQIAYLSATVTK